MPKDVSLPDFTQKQLLYSIVKESDIPPGSWCASRLPEPETQGIVLHSCTQPEDQSDEDVFWFESGADMHRIQQLINEVCKIEQ